MSMHATTHKQGTDVLDPSSDLGQFARRFPAKTLPEREQWIPEDNTAYALQGGTVRMYTISPESGRVFTVHIFRPGAVFPLIPLLTNHPNGFFFDVLSEAVVHLIPAPAFVKYLASHPRDHLELTKRLLTGMHRLAERLETLTFTNVYGRILSILLYFARHSRTTTTAGAVDLGPHTHQELSEFVGASREATSLALEQIAHKHLIVLHDHTITVPSIPHLVHELWSHAGHKHPPRAK